MPACYGWQIGDDEGILLLEDVSPAIQGDELRPCSCDHAIAVVQTVAKLHALTYDLAVSVPTEVERWTPAVTDPDTWEQRVARAASRYPTLFAEPRRRRVERLRAEALEAGVALDRGRVGWVHMDPHLDNVLWRDGGRAVLLDWSNARIGPPALDVAQLLFSLAFADPAALTPSELLDSYVTAAARHGQMLAIDQVVASAALALTVLLAGVVGWAGQTSNDGFHERKARLRDGEAHRVAGALEWLDRR